MKSVTLVVIAVAALATAKPMEETNKVSVTQDTLGNYRIEYRLGDTIKIEERKADGSVTGSYSYLDMNGKPQTVSYTAGTGGFRVLDDVAEFREALPSVETPVQVQDTPEVAAAKAEHLRLVEEARLLVVKE